MKNKAFVVFVSLISFLLYLSTAMGSKDTEHPAFSLLDHNGNDISSDSRVPYSPKKTCGECHDYDLITNAYHFQMGRTDAGGNIVVQDGLDPKNPWLISRGMYGKW
jgi:hypothetical protein